MNPSNDQHTRRTPVDRWRRRRRETQRLLAIYLRDHLAGAMAGLALIRRCGRANAGTELAEVLARIEAEIAEDCQTLEAIMDRLGVKQSRLKKVLGVTAEVVGRLKSNGRLFQYSPSSRVVELEMLAIGIVSKRSLWRALRVVVDEYHGLDGAALERLIGRATSQYEQVIDEHDRAATLAFVPTPS